MKYTILIALALLASPLFAQQPSISYLMCDEAKSQLQIHGSFGIDSGSVSIEDTTLGIVSWSDSLIICNLPDSSKGAGGHVEVQSKNGVSNKRVLSIFSLAVDHPIWSWDQGQLKWEIFYTRSWIISWRMDIALRTSAVDTLVRFEASKASFALFNGIRWPFYDTSVFFDHGVTFWGIVDLKKYRINFGQEKFKYAADKSFPDSAYYPFSIHFDTTGYITGYVDIYDPSNNTGVNKRTDSLFNAKILFPLGIKSSVSQLSQPNQCAINILFNMGSENNTITMQASSQLGKTIASLYTIDGKLLKRTKLDISAPGIFSIDVTGVHTHFAILVLQTEKGIITRKILF